MPSRFAVAGIFAFWLVTTGYVAYRDLWPRVFASGPPPVSIELADEARQGIPAKWTLYRNDQKAGAAYHPDEVPRRGRRVPVHLPVQRISRSYRATSR